jgi:hypothetical protein
MVQTREKICISLPIDGQEVYLRSIVFVMAEAEKWFDASFQSVPNPFLYVPDFGICPSWISCGIAGLVMDFETCASYSKVVNDG